MALVETLLKRNSLSQVEVGVSTRNGVDDTLVKMVRATNENCWRRLKRYLNVIGSEHVKMGANMQ